MKLNIGALGDYHDNSWSAHAHEGEHLSAHAREVPADATVENLITYLSLSLQDCAGFLATPRKRIDDYDCYDYDEEEPAEEFTGLAEKLTADGGTLLEPGHHLADYGLDEASCKEVTLFAVFRDEQMWPTVFKRDIEELGFGSKIYQHVRLNTEDKEIVEARKYFNRPLLQWLQPHNRSEEGKAELSQSVLLSMEDNFPQAPKTVLTVHIEREDGSLKASCMNMAGNHVCSVSVIVDAMAATLQSSLCEKLQWPCMNLWHGSEKVPETECELAKYSVLTAEQVATRENICGSYQHYETNVRPAGYSASGQNLASLLTLEPGKADLLHHFKGDYKRAEELRKFVMSDARWSIEAIGEGKHAVRLVGKAVLDRYHVHERCGPDGMHIQGYKCFAQVTIPLEQIEQGQTIDSNDYKNHSTEGGGWTCGSEDYRCSFFLPSCLLKVLRTKPQGETDTFVLRQLLNSDAAPDYPRNRLTKQMAYGRGRCQVVRLKHEHLLMLQHICEGLAGKADPTMEDIVDLQTSAPKPPAKAAGDEDSDEDCE